MTGWSFKKTFLRAFTLLLVSSVVAGEVTNVDCGDDVSFTSPNYPSNYPNDAKTKWFITAPEGRRILVTFTDFNIEVNDVLDLADIMDTQNSKRYTGEEIQFPPFLTKGNELKMTFISFSSGTRRGFNVSSSCYTNSRDSNVARIVGGNFPGKGFLELRNGTRSGDWRRVCKDSFDEMVTDVVCGELGYPTVRKVYYGTDDCKSDGQDCSKAPICNEYTYRLEDCSWSSGYCTSADAVKVECYEPGFKGCYDPEDLPQQNGFSFELTSHCVSSCRAITREALAIMIGTQCFCSTADEVNLPIITPTTCNKPTQDTRRVNNSFVYDVSVGFCDELDDVIHGSWDSNITWFGSIVHLTCDDGYRLNGGGILQCVPGLSPYYPIWNAIWNGSLPTCDMLEGTEWFPTTQHMEDITFIDYEDNTSTEEGCQPSMKSTILKTVLMGSTYGLASIILIVLIYWITTQVRQHLSSKKQDSASQISHTSLDMTPPIQRGNADVGRVTIRTDSVLYETIPDGTIAGPSKRTEGEQNTEEGAVGYINHNPQPNWNKMATADGAWDPRRYPQAQVQSQHELDAGGYLVPNVLQRN